MKIAVIGLGSMGKRRVRLIRELYPDYEILGIDTRPDRCEEAFKQSSIKTYDSIDKISDCDCAFVCTSPLLHANIITACLKKSWNVFTELNLVDDGYDRNISLANKSGVVLFMSSTHLYREEIQYIKNYITHNEHWNYIYHVGQYLPTWHPWENYKDFFVGEKTTNGCREFLAIELPWLIETFGSVRDTHSISDKMSRLKLDYNDNFVIQLTHSNGNKGALVIDVVSPCAVRNFEAYTEGKFISWSGKPNSVYIFDGKELKNVAFCEKAEHRQGYASIVIENAYKNEIREFFDVVKTGKKPLYDFTKDKAVLALIKEIGA